MEEACSFWGRKVAWRCFVAAILSAFTLTVASRYGDRGVIVFTNVHALDNLDMLRQLPFIVLVAALGGCLGAAFNWLRRLLWPARPSRSRKYLRVAEAVLVVSLSVLAQYSAAHFFGICQDIPSSWQQPPAHFKVREACFALCRDAAGAAAAAAAACCYRSAALCLARPQGVPDVA